MSALWDHLIALLAFARLATLLFRMIHNQIHATVFRTNSKMPIVSAKHALQIALPVILQELVLSAHQLTLFKVPSAHVTPHQPTKPS